MTDWIFTPAFDVDPWFLMLPVVWIGYLVLLGFESALMFYVNLVLKRKDDPIRGPLYSLYYNAANKDTDEPIGRHTSRKDANTDRIAGKILLVSFLYCVTLISYKEGLFGLCIWIFCIYIPIRTKIKEI